MSDVVVENKEFPGKLCDFFPPDHPDSRWLLRLMVIRDDIQFEVQELPIAEEATQREAWRTLYFLRRLTASLSEARNIFAFELGKFAKKPGDEASKALAPFLQKACATLKRLEKPIVDVRNAVGAHVEMKGAHGILKNHPNLAGTVTMMGPTQDVCYRELSGFAILFAWPDADDDEKVMAKHTELQEAALGAAGEVLRTVDCLLGYHFWKQRSIDLPENRTLGVRDKKDKTKYREVPRPPADLPTQDSDASLK